MWKLCIDDDQGNQTEVNLVRDSYTIGRAKESTIRLTERNVSRQHLRIFNDANGWHIEDLQSYNGSYLNGEPLADVMGIECGDFIELGDYRLHVDDDTTPLGEKRSTVTVPGGPASMTLRDDRLVMIMGPSVGAIFPLNETAASIGRGEECQIAVNDSSVSRVHADLTSLGDHRYEITDRNSSNGVRINGTPFERSILESGDVIELGDVQFKFVRKGEVFRLDPRTLSTGGSSQTEFAKLVPRLAFGASVVLALGAVMLWSNSDDSQANGDAPAAAIPEGTRLLTEAAAQLAQGDVAGAHETVSRIADESNARDTAEYREIQSAWADSLFEAASRAADDTERRDIFDKIAKSEGVDSTRRKRAVRMLAELDKQDEALNPDELPEVDPKPSKPVESASVVSPSSLPIATEPVARNPVARSAPTVWRPPTPRPKQKAKKPTRGLVRDAPF